MRFRAPVEEKPEPKSMPRGSVGEEDVAEIWFL